MLYQYRWLCAGMLSVLLFLTGYECYLSPLQNEISIMQQTLIDLSTDLPTTNVATDTYHSASLVQKNKLQQIASLVALMHVHGFVLNKVNQSADMTNVHIELQGLYPQWITLLNVLQQQTGLRLQSVTCRWTEKNNLQIDMNVLLSGSQQPENVIGNKIAIKNPFNVFCIAENIQKWHVKTNANALISIPLLQLKMVGYLQFDQQVEAMIALPNHLTGSVQRGDLLGIEHAVVTEIYPRYLVLELPDGKRVTWF